MPSHDPWLDLARAAFGGDPVIDTLRQMAARGQYDGIAVIAEDASRMLSGDALCVHLGEIRALVPQAERAWLIIAGLEANALIAAGHASPAIALARQVLQDALGRFDSDPASADGQSGLSVSLAILWKASSIARDPATARDAYQSALTAAQRLADTGPANAKWRDNVVAVHDELDALAAATGTFPRPAAIIGPPSPSPSARPTQTRGTLSGSRPCSSATTLSATTRRPRAISPVPGRHISVAWTSSPGWLRRSRAMSNGIPACNTCRSGSANFRPRTRLRFYHAWSARGTVTAVGLGNARAVLLRAAAERAGCEAILALADIKTTHSAFEEDEGYGYGRNWDEDEQDDYDFTPYSTEYEGYMGNWGNTLDRWYHRAAIVVWPRSQAFANRAETSPSWALDELTAMAADDRKSALASAGTRAPFWEGSVRGLTSGETEPAGTLLDKALRTAVVLGDAAAAQMLRMSCSATRRCASKATGLPISCSRWRGERPNRTTWRQSPCGAGTVLQNSVTPRS